MNRISRPLERSRSFTSVRYHPSVIALVMKSEALATRTLEILRIVSLVFLAGCGGGTSQSVNNQPPSPTPTITSGSVPTIDAIAPSCAPAGSVDSFVGGLTVVGANFVASSVVRWNGTDQPTTGTGSINGLTAQISASEIATPGTAAVTVFNPPPAGGSSNSLTFAITPGAVGPQSIAVDPAGKFAYVASLGCSGGAGGYLSIYTINPTTGALASIGPPLLTGDEGADFVTVDPLGKFAYVATPGNVFDYGTDAFGGVSTYTINPTTGVVTSTGAIYGTGQGFCCFNALAVDPSGKFAYVVNVNVGPAGSVSMYTINATTGALTSIGTIAAGTSPVSVAVGPSGKFAYVTNSGSNDVSMYTIDTTNGALTSIGTMAAGSTPTFIAIHPSGKFTYVTNSGSNDVSMYTIDGTTGALTSIGTIPAGTDPVSMAVDPAGGFAYVTNSGSNDVSMYSINATTGALTSTGTMAAGSTPTSIAIHPSGKFAYVTNSGSNDVSMYDIDTTTGVLTLIGTIGS
jgi:6-phosphogluconolactonase